MFELTAGFESLPPEYQRVMQLAQEQHQISVAPLQTLVGGWSGAMVFLVRVTDQTSGRVEHLILKLDRKNKLSSSDEISRHAAAQSKSTAEFVRDHFANLAFERVETDGAIAIFYSIAGQSLQSFRPLSNFDLQHQLETIFAATYQILLADWNVNRTFSAIHPRDLLEKWLGFRLDAGAPIESFIRQVCRVEPERPGFVIEGSVFPNPLRYARQRESWGHARPIDAVFGLQHGDLNTNNILVRFSPDGKELNGYYLIDFALFKSDMPLLYDLRYLEMSYLSHALAQASFANLVEVVLRLTEDAGLDLRRVPIEMAGVSAVIISARNSFERWVLGNHSSLYDDLWGQYWLAGVAAGLAYCHKTGQPDEHRLAGLIYAAANLKRYASSFSMPLPVDVETLYSQEPSDSDSPGAPFIKKPRHNLPAQSAPFIGRAAQVAALKELILKPEVRLITLLGPGGTGKTRLSLQVAQEALDHFAKGVFFVPLADDTDPNQFISRVAQQLDVKEGGRPLLENIKDFLRDRNILLVLDNFEQLISAAPVVAELLAAAAGLKIIASSRIALELQGEYEFQVPPMSLPQTDEPTIEELSGNESVILFVERARASNPNFVLTKDNASSVAEICRRLDGLPLALELAAARVKLLPPQAILSRLDDRFKLLTSGARDLPSRHQTLHNTLEWSYELLNADEKKLYARLGIFVGGFTLEAAEAVCNVEDHLDILEGVTSLINNSLLRQEDVNGEPRFSMLETIRAYALERLAESGEMESLRAAHAQYYGNIIQNQGGPGLYSAQAFHWLNWIERELDNIRATLNWSLISPERTEFGSGIVWWLIWFCYRRGYLNEGRMWANRFLASSNLQAASPSRAMVLIANGMMTLWQGEQGSGLAQIEEGLAIEQRLENEHMLAPAFLGKGVSLINMGRDSEARPFLEQAQTLFQQFYQPYFHIFTTVHLGNVELGLGNSEKALAWEEAAYAEARAINENWLLSFALNNLGEVARTQGKYDLAQKYYEECEVLLRDTGDAGDMARFVHSLGYIAQHEGNYERAESQFRKSLRMFRRLGNRRGMAECMAGLAGLKARQGQAEWGAVLLSAAESVLKATGGAWWPADRVEVEANQEFIRAALDEAELSAAQARGSAMTLEQALAFASESQ